MKKKLDILLGLLGVVTGVAYLALVNNLVAIVRWWQAFWASGGNSARMVRVEGCMGWLNWSAVDYSAVTTLIPVIGLSCCLRGLWRLRRGDAIDEQEFPFFKGSDQLHIALGLFGTLWGIIVIGYYQLESVTMGDLMQCLHTALFSTLTAVVWVFLIDRPLLRPYFQRLRGALYPHHQPHPTLADAARSLLTALQQGAEQVREELQQAHDTFLQRQERYELTFQNKLEALDQQHKQRTEQCQSALIEQLQQLDQALTQRIEQSDATYSKRLEQSNQALAEQLQQFAQAISQTQSSLTEHLHSQLASYDEACQRRQQELAETFAKQLNLLQQELQTERARAENLSAKLNTIAQALR